VQILTPPAVSLGGKVSNLADNIDKSYRKVVLLNGKLSSSQGGQCEGVRLNEYRKCQRVQSG